MNQLYASAIGTTVLQIKEIPPRPKEFDGVLCLFGVADDASEAAIRSELSVYGDIVRVVPRPVHKQMAVHFTTHEAVEKVIAAKLVSHLWKGLGALYNNRPYDERGW